MGDFEFDADLIRKYDCAGPRYTSYPTAAHFRTDFGPGDYRQAARERKEAEVVRPLALYVHIPFCASPCFYCACNRIITRSLDRARGYLARLHKEIDMQAECFTDAGRIEQMHFGGGTPTFLPTSDLAGIVEHLGQRFELTDSPDREYSIEIDPRTVSPEAIRELTAIGFNRMSVGVQDYDPHVQQAINRVQTPSETHRIVAAMRDAGVRSINFDLIYGLPEQSVETFSRTLDTVLEARPERLAVYAYAHLPQMFKAQRRLEAHRLPDAPTRLALLELAIRKLTAAGYLYIGMDHFALPTDDLVAAKREGTLQRNFQGYSTHADSDLVGLGVSAIGRVGRAYAQNFKRLDDYYRAIDSGELAIARGVWLRADDLVRGAVIQSLMCYEGIDCTAISLRFGIDFKRYFRAELERLQELQADGLIYIRNNSIRLTPMGRLLMRNVAMVFDACGVSGRVWSKAI